MKANVDGCEGYEPGGKGVGDSVDRLRLSAGSLSSARILTSCKPLRS